MSGVLNLEEREIEHLYRGSFQKETTTETIDKARFDVLIGMYFQPATRQSFDIFFTRMK
jgi:hypothetical protein